MSSDKRIRGVKMYTLGRILRVLLMVLAGIVVTVVVVACTVYSGAYVLASLPPLPPVPAVQQPPFTAGVTAAQVQQIVADAVKANPALTEAQIKQIVADATKNSAPAGGPINEDPSVNNGSKQQPAPGGNELLTSIPSGSPLGLKYQHDTSCEAAGKEHELEYPACWLQKVQFGEISGEDAVRAIQALTIKYNTHSEEAMVVEFDNRQPVGAWCPGGTTYKPPDTARPLEGTKGARWADLLFVVDRSPEGEPGTKRIEAKDHPCWVFYRR